MDKKDVIIKLKRYKKILSEEMSFEAMILFGSYAKGSQKQHSDIDVAIVVDTMQGNYFSTRSLLWRTRREVDDRIEPVLLEKSNDESGFLKEVMRHGISI